MTEYGVGATIMVRVMREVLAAELARPGVSRDVLFAEAVDRLDDDEKRAAFEWTQRAVDYRYDPRFDPR